MYGGFRILRGATRGSDARAPCGGWLATRALSALAAALRLRVFGLALLLLPRPLAEDAPVLRGEPRLRVERQVGVERHRARLDLRAHLVELALALALRVRGPLRERKLAAPLVHVLLQKPGRGRDVRVPGPDRLRRVAVVARAAEDGLDLGRHARVGAHRPALVHGRVRAVGSEALRPQKDERGDD